MKKKQSKNILRVTCPHCYWINAEYPDNYNLLCGDGGIGDLESHRGDYYLSVGCVNCGKDFKMLAYIPEYVDAELSDDIDYEEWLDAREIDSWAVEKAQSDYAEFPIEEAISLIIKHYRSTKRPPALGKLKVDKQFKSAWKELIDECWEKRDRIEEEE
jgi:hypothetical protein